MLKDFTEDMNKSTIEIQKHTHKLWNEMFKTQKWKWNQ